MRRATASSEQPDRHHSTESPLGRGVPSFEAVRRIGEIDGAGTVQSKIIWIIEPMRLKAVDDDRLAALIVLKPNDSPSTMLTEKQAALESRMSPFEPGSTKSGFDKIPPLGSRKISARVEPGFQR